MHTCSYKAEDVSQVHHYLVYILQLNLPATRENSFVVDVWSHEELKRKQNMLTVNAVRITNRITNSILIATKYSVYDDKLQCNCHLPAPDRKHMTHHQALQDSSNSSQVLKTIK
jgi:hypothetical protein